MRSLIIEFSVTSGCNLSCKYCYSRHEPQYMRDFDIQKFENIISPIMQYYKCDTYHISYFGGEPLLNWDIIKTSLPEFSKSKLCSSIVLISNGLLLTKPKVDFLKKFKCGLSWSFDGLWSANRPLEGGKSSFELYESILPLAKSLTSSCKVMVSPVCKDFVKNLEYFISRGIKHPDFSLVRDNIWTDGSIVQFQKEMQDLTDFILQEHKRGNIVSTGLHTLYTLDSLAGAKFGKRDHGCFVGSNGITYTWDHKIFPCERFRSNSKFCLYDGTYNYEALEFLKSVSNPQEYEKCQNCELYKYCNAGCTYSQFDKDFQSVEPLDCICELQKICYKEGLRLYKDSTQQYRDFIHSLFRNAK